MTDDQEAVVAAEIPQDEIQTVPDLTSRGTPRKYKRSVFYSPDFAERAGKLARMGAFDSEIARHLGVSHTTIMSWKKRHPEFRAAMERGRFDADMQVAAALFRRATGGTSREVKVFLNKGEPVVVPYEKEFLPDVDACIFWLRNRRPEVWRDKLVLAAETQSAIPETLTAEQEETLKRIARIRAEGEALAFGGQGGCEGFAGETVFGLPGDGG